MLSTKILGDLTKKVSMPQVVGALLAGVIIGPTGLGIIAETDFIAYTAEIGVIMLMFLAGLDTDINEIKKNSVACIVVDVYKRQDSDPLKIQTFTKMSGL